MSCEKQALSHAISRMQMPSPIFEPTRLFFIVPASISHVHMCFSCPSATINRFTQCCIFAPSQRLLCGGRNCAKYEHGSVHGYILYGLMQVCVDWCSKSDLVQTHLRIQSLLTVSTCVTETLNPMKHKHKTFCTPWHFLFATRFLSLSHRVFYLREDNGSLS